MYCVLRVFSCDFYHEIFSFFVFDAKIKLRCYFSSANKLNHLHSLPVLDLEEKRPDINVISIVSTDIRELKLQGMTQTSIEFVWEEKI